MFSSTFVARHGKWFAQLLPILMAGLFYLLSVAPIYAQAPPPDAGAPPGSVDHGGAVDGMDPRNGMLAMDADGNLDGNVDGAWSLPRNDLGETPVTCQDINNSPDDKLNENIVRYGQPLGAPDCGQPGFRSGFGFNGADQASFAPGVPFLLGQFTHYNESIVTPLAPMQFVDLTVNVQVGAPAIDTQMLYTMRLEETVNSGSCPYGTTNNDLCDDRVDFLNNTPPQTIVVDGVTYTLNILGFVPGITESCTYSPEIVDYFITGEMMRNDACIFAEFIIPAPALAIDKAPDLQQLSVADAAEFTITVTNMGNVGFNEARVADPQTPDCERTIEGFKRGTSVSYVCTAYDVEEDFDNVATVTAVFDGNVYTAEDRARVNVLAPDTASLYALKYHDANSNGQRDADEPGLYGWTLCVKDADGVTVGFCQVTDSAGRATLAPNQAGELQLCEEPQVGWVNTDPGNGAACKPISATEGPLYAEFAPNANDLYGIELADKRADDRQWTYMVYQYFDSKKLHNWMLSLPACIDANHIDSSATTPGWSIVDDPATGLHGIQWQTPAGVDPVNGGRFVLAFVQPYPTGAAGAGIAVNGPPIVAATASIAGPTCATVVEIGNATELPAGGELEVRKVVLPASDAGRFNLAIDGVIYASDVGDGGATGKQMVTAGVHIVGEGGGAQTDLDDYMRSLRCTDRKRGTTWMPAASGEVNIGLGDDIVCVFTNIRRGAIRIVKQATGAGGGDWSFAGTTVGVFTLPSAGGQQTFTRLAPGAYLFTEAAAPGWSLAQLSCADPDSGSATDLASRTASVELDPGETVVCTFVNIADAGRISIVKRVDGVADTPWRFESALGAFTLPATGGQQVFNGVAPGVYNVMEAAKESWHVAAIQCNDPDSATVVDPTAGMATIDLDANEEITCIFVNQPGQPGVTLDKRASRTVIYPNDPVTYTLAVTNTGQVPLHNVRIDDRRCAVSALLTGEYNAGDADQDGWLDPGEAWTFTCTTTLAQDTTNMATAWAQAPWGESVWSTASAAVDVIAPRLAIEKQVDRPLVHAGETVNYQIVVRNTGDTSLYNVVVEDSLPACAMTGPAGDNGNHALEPGEAWSYTCAMAVAEKTVNLATVTGNDLLGNPWYDEARAVVDVYTPEIQVVKLADRTHIYPGDAVNFAIKVRNTGTTMLGNVTVVDSLPQCALRGPESDDGDGQLAVGEEWTYTCGLTVCPGQTATVADNGIAVSATASDPARVWDLASIDEQVAPACTPPSPTLVGPSFGSCWSPANRWFELTVVNRATIPAYIGYDIYRVSDSFRNLGRFDVGQRTVFTVTQEGTLRKYIGANGQTNWQQLGGTHTLNIAGHVSHGYLCDDTPVIPPLCSDVTNTVEVTARDSSGYEVIDNDAVFVDLLHPGIDVTKSVDKSEIAPGEEVKFTISVKNSGDIGLLDLTIEDSLPACTLSAAVGDDGNRILDVLETWIYTCTMSPADDVTNTVRATARDPQGRTWSDEDSVFVDVIRPALAIVKEADKTVVYPGETVNFTLRVRNQGNVTLSQVNVTDSMPACNLSRPRGDNGNRRLDPGEEWVYTCKVTFCQGERLTPDSGIDDAGIACTPSPSSGVCKDSTNIGRVSAKDPRGRTLSASDRVFIDLIRPGISVTKKASRAIVSPGAMVDFTIRVKNTGDTPLTSITVIDEQPACQLSAPSGDNGNGILDGGEAWIYTCKMPIMARTNNVATATGVDMLGNHWRGTGAALVRTSCTCMTVAGLQNTDDCLTAEIEAIGSYFLFLPATRR